MDKSIDLTKILKYCPVRTKLYSTIFGEVEFISINKYTYKIKFETKDGMIYSVTSNGRHRYEYNGECTLFPSKDQRDWNKFTAPWYNKLIEHKFHVGQYITDGYAGGKITSIEDNYNCYKILDFTGGINTSIPFTLQDNYHLWTIQDAKDGDVLCCKSGWMCIFKTINNHTNTFSSYCFMDSDKCFFNIGIDGHTLDKKFINAYNGEIYPATKEQRGILFQKMKEAGYKWNADTKTLEKLVKHKFDPKTFKSFDKVLVKCSSIYNSNLVWRVGLFSYFYVDDNSIRIYTLGSDDNNPNLYVIPYNDDTKHLVNTTEEAPEYYRYWED